jgi:RNA polymerase sigma factor (sigma-70 family)
MSSPGSVTNYLRQFQAGDRAGFEKLWERYYPRLVKLARKKLQGLRRGAADESDVAASALDSFVQSVEQGRLPQILDRDGLWHLLVVVTTRKASRLRRHERRLKRGGGHVLDEAALPNAEGDPEQETGLEQILAREPTPEEAALTAEELPRLLHLLPDPALRDIALRKLEGYTNGEIAAEFGCVRRTIERQLRVIRSLWSKEIDP